MSIISLENAASSEEKPTSNSVLLIIPDTPKSVHAQTYLRAFKGEFRTYVLTSSLPGQREVSSYAKDLAGHLAKLRIRRATICGIGPGASLAQAVALDSPKLVRRLVLLDASTRLAPGLVSRMVDRLESLLPLGLPLRRLSGDFDSRPMLHRVSCPSLVLVSRSAGEYMAAQSSYIAKKIPNAWHCVLGKSHLDSKDELSEEFCQLVKAFLQVPTKRPQKNR